MTPRQIKTLRARLGETQPQFAQRLGVSLQTVKSWEGGQRNPSGMARKLLAMVKRELP